MKEIKQLKPQNPKWLPTCKPKVEKKTPPNHNSLIDSVCTKEVDDYWVIRAQSENNCANDKQMESQTNSKLTLH